MKYLILLTLFVPSILNAQTAVELTRVFLILFYIIDSLIPIIIGIALIVFIWGIIRYVITSSESDKKEAVSIIIYGLITLFVMVAVWGLVAVIGNTFNIYDRSIPLNQQSIRGFIR